MCEFSHESVLHSFSRIAVWLCNFLAKNISAKAARKMLMKLTTGVDFTNILSAAFKHPDPKSAKNKHKRFT